MNPTTKHTIAHMLDLLNCGNLRLATSLELRTIEQALRDATQVIGKLETAALRREIDQQIAEQEEAEENA